MTRTNVTHILIIITNFIENKKRFSEQKSIASRVVVIVIREMQPR